MNINKIQEYNLIKNSPSNLNFKANFVFTRRSAYQFKKEMKNAILEHPFASILGKNPLQTLVKNIKNIHPEKNIKIYKPESVYMGLSYINNYKPVFSDVYWIAKSGFKAVTAELNDKKPIQTLLEKIIDNPEYFFKD